MASEPKAASADSAAVQGLALRSQRDEGRPMDQFEGKIAVVTGAASGIGRAVAQALCSRGMKVALADIEPAALERAVAELRAAGHTVIGRRTDVSQRADIEGLAEAVVTEWGAIHVAHNNAGVVRGGSLAEIPQATWDWVLGVDLWSVIWGTEIFLRHIRAAGGGHILNTASTAGLQAANSIAPYSVAKFGVVALTETLRMELDANQEPIGATVLCPGAVNTQIVFSDRNQPADVAQHALSDTEKAFQARAGTTLATRGMDPTDVAALVVDAIEHNKFWIVTHSEWITVMEARVRGMATGDLVQGFGG
jgi:NAD(P)-dependent dehydrogenase (short-subunit alcohol dehydrogenase family)